MERAASRNPDVDRWFEGADHPLDETMRRAREIILGADERVSDGKLVRTMRFSGLDELEAGRADLETAVRAWCDWKAG